MATTTLQLYWDLASYDASVRQSAAHSLIRTLADFQKTHEASLSEQGVADTEETLDALCASDVSYAVRRLLRGLPSSRQGARQGFSLALTEVRGYNYLKESLFFIHILRSSLPLWMSLVSKLYLIFYLNIQNVLVQ
jgi:hypothetical protein